MDTKTFITPKFITAQELKEVRKNLKLTQKEFADLVNCSKSTVERWEISKEGIEGPIVLLIQMLQKYPQYTDSIRIPEKVYPLRLWYMYRNKPCTLIDVNEMEKKIRIVNYTEHMMFRAFGAVENPDYTMYEDFLESRCFPQGRDKLKLVLQDLDLPFYDPFLIIKKTQGRMAEDEFWIKVE